MNIILQRKLLLVVIFLLLQIGLIAKDKILIIHSYGIDNSWVKDQTKGIKDILGNKYEFYEFHMNTKKIPKNKFKQKAQEAINYYKDIKPTLVFTTDDNALKFVGSKLYKEIPIVFGGINGNIREDYPWVLNTNSVSGVLERPLIKRSIHEIKKILNLKGKVLFILGDSTTSRTFFKEEFEDNYLIGMSKNDIHVLNDFNHWKELILSSKKNGYDMLMISGYQAMHNANNNHIDSNTISKWISKNSPIPSFTIHAKQVGKDLITGAMILDGVSMGNKMGDIAKKILNSDIDSSKRMIYIHNKLNAFFSKTELNKWNLSISTTYDFPVSLLD